jgi:hypothetical protein
MSTTAIDVREPDAFHVEPCALQHEGLDRDVVRMRRLDASGGLHLDEAVAAVAPLEHVGPHEDVAVGHGRLEQHDVLGAFEQVARLAQCAADVVDVAHQPAAGPQPARDFAHAVPRGEACPRTCVDRGEVAPVALQPQPLRALAIRQQSGFGERRCHRGWKCASRARARLAASLAGRSGVRQPLAAQQ